MTQDLYEKAKSIKEKISILIDIKNTIINSKLNQDRKLAAIDKKLDSFIIIKDCELPEYIKIKFISILDEEINKNENMFESL